MYDDRESDHFVQALGDINDAYRAFRPPHRISVAEGVAKALMLKRPGSAAQHWSGTDTPYMIQPMNNLASRYHNAVCFVGPAQSGKTASLGEGWVSHAVVNDPGDMLMVQMTEAKAREYSKQRIDRMILNSPKINALMSNSARDDNTHDKSFRHGMWLRIAWPTVTNLSSTSYRYVFETDFDRWDADLGGEGDGFTLALARIRTFMSRGMVCVESSPGFPITDANWTPSTPHEAPPCNGILSIYNRSDRHRWYWACIDCRHRFEATPGVDLFNLPGERELVDAVRTTDLNKMAAHYAKVVCPHCGSLIDFKHRYAMNLNGVWLRDKQTMTPDGEILGEGITSSIAGFWLGGVAAAYQDWKGLLEKHLQGLRDYALTGDEKALQVAVNTDQGAPYLSRHLAEARGNRRSPSERVEERPRYICPPETRCVIASVDVQGGTTSRFVVQVHAIGPNMEQWLVNRYDITKSKRKGMSDEFAQIDPANYTEDWDVLTEEVLRKTYRTEDEEVEIRVKMLVVDSGGEAGATGNAYLWYRRLRTLGLHNRVRLYKGGSIKNAPTIKLTMVGASKPGQKGDIPLLLCNTDSLSDQVEAGLKRQDPGPGYVHFPKWLPPAFFDELTAEQRNKHGVWMKIRKRNESFDLCRMIRVGMLALQLDKIKNWNEVPQWLMPLDQNNSEVISRDHRRELQANTLIASAVEVVEPEVRAHSPRTNRRGGRRTASSPYLK